MQKSILTWFFFINKKNSKKSLLTCNYVNCLLWMIWSSYETLQWSWTYLPKNTLQESQSYLPFSVLIGFLLIFTPVFCYFPINHRPPLIGYSIRQISQSRKTGVQTEKLRIFKMEVTFFSSLNNAYLVF